MFAALLLGLLTGQHADRGQPLRFGGVVQQEEDDHHAYGPGHRGADESPLPAEDSHDGAHEEEREEFAEVVAGAEKPVIGAADAQREPAREGDDGRRGAHRLCPAVESPHHGKGREEGHVAHESAAVGKTQHPDQQVRHRRDAEPRGHEALDVAVVGEESVDELPDGIGEEQGRADQTELRGVERPAFEDGFLHHVEARPTDVIETVPDGSGQKALETEPAIEFHAGRVVAREQSRGSAFAEKGQKRHDYFKNSS